MKEYFDIGKGFPRGDKRFVMSRTELVSFYDCPWAWRRGRVFNGNKSTEWGSLVDCMYLTPEKFKEWYAVRPDTYPKPTKTNPNNRNNWHHASSWCKDWLRQHAGKTVVSDDDFKSSQTAVSELRRDSDATRVFGSADKQVICQWEYHDQRTGITVPLKCMLDGVGTEKPYLADLKTARSSKDWRFRKSAQDLRYDVQVAFYKWGYQQCHEDRNLFVFVVQENSAPYPIATYLVSADKCISGKEGTKHYGRDIAGYEKMLEKYCHCLATDQWPSYTEEPKQLTIFD